MKIYSFITTERTANRQGAHKFERIDLRIGSAADSVQIAEVIVNANEAHTVVDGRNTPATIYTLSLDGKVLKTAVQVKGGRVKMLDGK